MDGTRRSIHELRQAASFPISRRAPVSACDTKFRHESNLTGTQGQARGGLQHLSEAIRLVTRYLRETNGFVSGVTWSERARSMIYTGGDYACREDWSKSNCLP
ncbi:uncharacterized protein MYCFIDRAFT_159038 [Pseudocercospora fijiensis CIRAD86]|uniref:Uncharacterized protein n=1 Tax=Pseudocercospora fijiensis (strain CIRAD86) TaxID=383855 RepID=N1QAB6_PSEFD|nr:uncharacterized protein MYCFIDRAFT_159038 [Pseudocercospora fijiensis CIRAD86]EME87847.1 hypothetical protein MYCFIDRAFT_159038 [Pseudocercospora fijiensis CIRAD86]